MKYVGRWLFVICYLLLVNVCLASAHDERKDKPPSMLVSSSAPDPSDDEQRSDKQSKSFTVGKGGDLDVEVSNGNVHVRTWDKNQVEVHYTFDNEEEDDRGVRISQSGNTVHVITDTRWSDGEDIDFDISIPVQFNVSIETAAGDITITGKVAGTVECQTSGGNISTGSVDGKIDLTTSGGDVIADDVKGDVLINTSGGNIRVGSVAGVTDVRTSGGDIEIERAGKKLTAETAGGNVHVGDIGADVMVETAGGDIILDHVAGGASLSTSGGNIDLKSAHGDVVMKTAGGDVHADSIYGSIDAKTSAGNIEVLLIPSGSKKSRISTNVGDVRLFIPENAKATITARNRLRNWGYRYDSDEEAISSDYKEESYDNDGRNREVRATYSLNGGGQAISIEASMGNIQILKPGSHIRHSHTQKFRKKYRDE